jgi:hypothetical protein
VTQVSADRQDEDQFLTTHTRVTLNTLTTIKPEPQICLNRKARNQEPRI